MITISYSLNNDHYLSLVKHYDHYHDLLLVKQWLLSLTRYHYLSLVKQWSLSLTR